PRRGGDRQGRAVGAGPRHGPAAGPDRLVPPHHLYCRGPGASHAGGPPAPGGGGPAGHEGAGIRLFRPRQRLSAPQLRQPPVRLLHRHPRQRHRPGLVRPRRGSGAGLRRAVSGRLRPGECPAGAAAVRHGQHGGVVRGPDAGLPGPGQRGADQRPRRGGGQLALADGPRRGRGRAGGGDPGAGRSLRTVKQKNPQMGVLLSFCGIVKVCQQIPLGHLKDLTQAGQLIILDKPAVSLN
ncbi:Minicell-associated protein DivIVA, partial [Dysosmobacter welbionis]